MLAEFFQSVAAMETTEGDVWIRLRTAAWAQEDELALTIVVTPESLGPQIEGWNILCAGVRESALDGGLV